MKATHFWRSLVEVAFPGLPQYENARCANTDESKVKSTTQHDVCAVLIVTLLSMFACMPFCTVNPMNLLNFQLF